MAGTATRFPAFPLPRKLSTCSESEAPSRGLAPAERNPINGQDPTDETHRTARRDRTHGRRTRAHSTVSSRPVPSVGSRNPFLSCTARQRRCAAPPVPLLTCPVSPACLVVEHLLHLAPSTSRLIIPRERARTGNGYRCPPAAAWCLPSLPLQPGLPLRAPLPKTRPDQTRHGTNPNLRGRGEISQRICVCAG